MGTGSPFSLPPVAGLLDGSLGHVEGGRIGTYPDSILGSLLDQIGNGLSTGGSRSYLKELGNLGRLSCSPFRCAQLGHKVQYSHTT